MKKTIAVLLFAAASLCLFGCPEEKATPEPPRAATTAKAAAPGAAATATATATAKAADPGGGW